MPLHIDWHEMSEAAETLKATAELVALIVGAIWGGYKIREFRDFKHLIQFNLEAHIYPLTTPVNASSFTWSKKGDRLEDPEKLHTHAVEVLLTLDNKGKTRFKLFNLQISILTMRPASERAKFDGGAGYVSLSHLKTSGNLVPAFEVDGMSPEKSSFYYVEPGVTQVISYLALISEPRDLIQVVGKFSLEQQRLFPKTDRLSTGLYPHTVARTYPVVEKGKSPVNVSEFGKETHQHS